MVVRQPECLQFPFFFYNCAGLAGLFLCSPPGHSQVNPKLSSTDAPPDPLWIAFQHLLCIPVPCDLLLWQRIHVFFFFQTASSQIFSFHPSFHFMWIHYSNKDRLSCALLCSDNPPPPSQTHINRPKTCSSNSHSNNTMNEHKLADEHAGMLFDIVFVFRPSLTVILLLSRFFLEQTELFCHKLLWQMPYSHKKNQLRTFNYTMSGLDRPLLWWHAFPSF